MSGKFFWLGAGLALGLVVAGCAASHAAETKKDKPPVAAPEHATRLQPMSRQEQIAFVRQDLATRMGIEPDTVSFSGATPVRWRSGALGCPKPGMSYTQALVPGVLFMLRIGDAIYRYHSLPGGQPFYCPAVRAEPPSVNSGDI